MCNFLSIFVDFILFRQRVVLYRFSTSNHNFNPTPAEWASVVLYRFSTSNHNFENPVSKLLGVVLYRFSTSNHNRHRIHQAVGGLYYIVSLHQTTTDECYAQRKNMLYYIVSLHQTTTNCAILTRVDRCIISFLYIKPQL